MANVSIKMIIIINKNIILEMETISCPVCYKCYGDSNVQNNKNT